MKPMALLIVALAIFILSPRAATADAGIDATVVNTRPLVENRRTAVTVKLRHNGGFPVMAEELQANAGQAIYIVAVDPALEDFHYKVPVVRRVPGEYVFTMTPGTPCNYYGWAVIDTLRKDPQYIPFTIKGAADCKDRQPKTAAADMFEGDNYNVRLETQGFALEAGQESVLTFTVRDKSGRYIHELEPVHGAFAHVVGFYNDHQAIAVATPQLREGERLSHLDRGGPVLEFSFMPVQDGFMKLFARFRINGQDVLASFGIPVDPDPLAYMPLEEEEWSEEWEGDWGQEPVVEQEPQAEQDLSRLEELIADDDEKYGNPENESANDLQDLFRDSAPPASVDVYEDTEAEILRDIR